jgi:hypothetical protein
VPDRALARCTRLQSLSSADYYAQLHTLRDVDFAAVSAAAIAAALPRLHTLDCSQVALWPVFSTTYRRGCGYFI